MHRLLRRTGTARFVLRAYVLLALGAIPAAPTLGADEPEPPPGPTYSVLYDVRLVPTERAARVTIRLGSGAENVAWIRFRIDPERHRDFAGDGDVSAEADTVEWKPPKRGGAFRYTFRIDHLRDERSYDARCAENWALFRGDDLVPPGRIRIRRGAQSRARLRLRLPEGWSVATPYARAENGTFAIEHFDRGFDRPTGWFVAGKLGILRERIAGIRVVVAGPTGQGLQRMDILALLRWTLPTLTDLVPDPPARLLIVSAGDPMWRGGLSGPNSLYVHASRPLVTQDGSSPILHELMHTVLGTRSGPDGDWIVEGLAELYSLELLVRSRTISHRRYERALARLDGRGRNVSKLRVPSASGEVTARAVTVLRRLDRQIRDASAGERSLNDVMRRLAAHREAITTDGFRALAEQVAGRSLESFFQRYVPN